MPVRNRTWGLLVSVVLALAQVWRIVTTMGIHFQASSDAALGVTVGTPHWRVFQNRVLGPYLAKAFAVFLPTYETAVVFVMALTLIAATWLCLRLGSLHAGQTGAVIGLVVFHALMLFVANPPWYYIWDPINTLVFLAMVWLIAENRSWRWYVGLWAVAILNHEIALLIPVWMVVDPLVRRSVRAVPSSDQRFTIGVGLICGLASLVIVETLRSALLVRELGPTLFPLDDTGSAGRYFFLKLGDNISTVAGVFANPSALGVGLLFLLFGLLFAVAVLGRFDAWRYTGFTIVNLVQMTALLSFGLALETRIYSPVIPLLVVAAAVAVRVTRSDPRFRAVSA